MSFIPVICPLCNTKLKFKSLDPNHWGENGDDFVISLDCARDARCLSYYLNKDWEIKRLSFYDGTNLVSYEGDILEILDCGDRESNAREILKVPFNCSWFDLAPLLRAIKAYIVFV